jgi:hypothetical protein
VECVTHMLDQVGLNVQKYQFKSKMCLPLKNGCETSRCLISDRWSNDESDSVVVVIVTDVSLIIDDNAVQDNATMHDQIGNARRV